MTRRARYRQHSLAGLRPQVVKIVEKRGRKLPVLLCRREERRDERCGGAGACKRLHGWVQQRKYVGWKCSEQKAENGEKYRSKSSALMFMQARFPGAPAGPEKVHGIRLDETGHRQCRSERKDCATESKDNSDRGG